MTKQDTAQRPQETEHKPVIPTTQLIATALAAVTAAFLGSFIGTAGTVIGAGLASVITTVASSLYQHSLDRTRSKVRSTVSQVRQQRDTSRTKHPAAPAEADADAPTVRLEPLTRQGKRIRWGLVTGITAAMFLVGIGVVTGVELLHGGPLSGGDNGTSVGHLFGQPTDRDPAPTTTNPTHPSTPSHESATTTTPSAPTSTSPQPGLGVPPTTTTPPPTTTSVPPTTTAPAAPPATTGLTPP